VLEGITPARNAARAREFHLAGMGKDQPGAGSVPSSVALTPASPADFGKLIADKTEKWSNLR
jgi:hypothetical protein